MFGDLFGAAEKMLANASPGDVQDAAEQHVSSLPTGELVNHLLGMIPNLPDAARSELASTVLGALGQNGTSEAAVAGAGVPTDDAKDGNPAALSSLVQHASSNDPSSLKDAAISFISNNPQLIQQYAPKLIQGILGRLGS